MFDEHLQFAQKLAKKGGKLLKKNFGRLSKSQIEIKDCKDVVTSVDKEVERMYAKAIRNKFPDCGIIGEEGTSYNVDKEFVWVFDPLDGTKNYSMQVPFYATAICLMRNNEPVMSVIYVPQIDKLYYAIRGKGAFLNGKKIHVSKTAELTESYVLYCHKPNEKSIKNVEKYAAKLKLATKGADRLKTASGEMGLVAQGLCEAYLLDELPIWDLVSGALIIREAGGRATDFTGKEWAVGDKNILVSNGSGIHEKILDVINS
jgi:myo-inositol-1(or 4)-monophosphatase